jgi:cephalosporin-C deacetylase-like acetyl esterase
MKPMRRAAPLLAAALLLAACGQLASDGASPLPTIDPEFSFPPEALDTEALTAYDARLPLDLAAAAAPREVDGATVHDVSWLSPLGGRVTAWLVVPHGEGPYAGIVYLHGSETWRDDFLDEAIAMARGGAVSLVLDAPFARLGENRRTGLQAYRDPERERQMTAQAVVDARRAFDVLLARDDVDPARLAFVGHSWGASLGLVLAAVDERPGSLVLIAPRPSWTEFLRTSDADFVKRERDRTGAAGWERYLELMAPLDAMAVADEVDPGRVYMQYGTQDDVIPVDVAKQLVDALDGVKADFYPAAHALDDGATAQRVAWLVDRLALTDIGADILATVGLPDE